VRCGFSAVPAPHATLAGLSLVAAATRLHAAKPVEHHGAETAVDVVHRGLEETHAGANADRRACKVVERLSCGHVAALEASVRDAREEASRASSRKRILRACKKTQPRTQDAQAQTVEKGIDRNDSQNNLRSKRILQRSSLAQHWARSAPHTPLLKIPVWWRRAVLPSLPWVVRFLSFFTGHGTGKKNLP